MKYTAIVEGMNCNGCANSVKAAFTQVEGVQEVKVNLDAKEADIISQIELSEDKLKEALADTTYTVVSVSSK
ncbi:MAG: heavy-metal-associated domain-containing protein [Alkalibacterium thalassium]|jgi:copper chaperone|nr:heavy-metal-associated domain-containing protein [Alkalibacterium thalassium]